MYGLEWRQFELVHQLSAGSVICIMWNPSRSPSPPSLPSLSLSQAAIAIFTQLMYVSLESFEMLSKNKFISFVRSFSLCPPVPSLCFLRLCHSPRWRLEEGWEAEAYRLFNNTQSDHRSFSHQQGVHNNNLNVNTEHVIQNKVFTMDKLKLKNKVYNIFTSSHITH